MQREGNISNPLLASSLGQTKLRELLSSRWNVIKSKSARRGNVEFFSAVCKRSLRDFNFKLALLTINSKNHLSLEMIKLFCSQCKREKLKLLQRSLIRKNRSWKIGRRNVVAVCVGRWCQANVFGNKARVEGTYSLKASDSFSSRSRSMPFLLALIYVRLVDITEKLEQVGKYFPNNVEGKSCSRPWISPLSCGDVWSVNIYRSSSSACGPGLRAALSTLLIPHNCTTTEKCGNLSITLLRFASPCAV